MWRKLIITGFVVTNLNANWLIKHRVERHYTKMQIARMVATNAAIAFGTSYFISSKISQTKKSVSAAILGPGIITVGAPK